MKNTILIVDDAVSNIKSLSKIFENEYDVIFALNGQDALALLESEKIDLVLLDVEMPQMDGFEVIKRMKNISSLPEALPVIFVTAMAEETQIKGLELGAVDYITKPISPLIVKARVKNHITTKLLTEQIKEQIEQNHQKDALLFQQSKLASMGEMLGNIAHQWRQPLSVITTIASGIKLSIEFETFDEQQAVKDIDALMRNASYLSQTIDDFRTFLKGSNNSEKDAFDISKTIYMTLELLKPMFTSKNIALDLNLSTTKNVYGYKNELIQSFINILTNAKDAFEINHTEERIMKINLLSDEDSVFIEIIDNAGGIPDGVLQRVFEPYFTTKHQSQGTGIGLYMTHQIITEKFKGKIEVSNVEFVSNELPQKGAKFLVTLPIEP